MGEFGFGDHIILVYLKSSEQWQKVMPYIKEGLLYHEKIVYIADDNKAEDVKNAMLEWDKELFKKAFKQGDINILSSQETYHQSGEFDPEDMYLLIAKMEQEALAQGYKGVRGCGEMTWMFRDDVIGVDKVVEYEENLTAFLQGRKISAICMYSKVKFGPEMINLMRRIHSKQV